ncbi:alpha/beta fold hydrolase [Micromonosporaceae bacterium B7E4]
MRVPVPGGALAGWTTGTAGPRLLLVHGGGVDARIWSEVLDPLAAGCRVATYDRRGAGRSRPLPAGDPVADLRAVRAEVFGTAPAWLLGSSLGATVALAAAVRYGTAGLVLESPAFANSPADRRQAVLRAAAGRGAPALVEAWLGDPHLGPRRPAARDLLGTVLAANVDLFTAPPAGAFTPPGSDRLRRLTGAGVPVLVLAGERDAPELLDHYAEVVPAAGGTLVRVPDAGHLVHLDAPDRWRAEVHGFLLRRSPG